ncbi:hypothetical protein QLQ12_17545 [Actinoplanes sp. NEAU-A12]|uniref:Glycosyltransferase n=1 Tax=Actinoplanes sandaracinus TaxID=3045177 RepID=A0ABT6WL85_9ACTN|nr:hypothetical protein [Actinoplanes sandaracinus]MDI6100415.1 hypothetical protein [Actinoplanes sandaracinus]
MRNLFASVPAAGHLPTCLLPLIEAAGRAGHEVALLTDRSMRAVSAAAARSTSRTAA